MSSCPERQLGETPAAWRRRINEWTREQRALTQGATPEQANEERSLLARMERRNVRIEMKLIQALRFMGLHPSEASPDTSGQVVMVDGCIVATSVDVRLRDVNLCAVLSGLKGDIPVVIAGRPWGVVNIANPTEGTTHD